MRRKLQGFKIVRDDAPCPDCEDFPPTRPGDHPVAHDNRLNAELSTPRFAHGTKLTWGCTTCNGSGRVRILEELRTRIQYTEPRELERVGIEAGRVTTREAPLVESLDWLDHEQADELTVEDLAFAPEDAGTERGWGELMDAAKLTAKQRFVFERRMDGHTEEEIGIAMGVSKMAVSHLWQRAAKLMREAREGVYELPV